ncbi:MAG: YfhO family protein, partial [Candidatus Izemoplasmatales bacterium]|nr:YfhO family protein [Candidatus Izemoplasmatales bacterium]
MKLNLRAIKGKIHQFREKASAWFTEVFSSPKKTIFFLGMFVFTVLFLIQITIILISNSFYNGGSDDVCQYYPMMNDFILKIKTGTLSWYNLNNYLGASFFSDTYYVPIDIFTFITFLLSYVMPIGVAISSTELIKALAGVMILAYYFYLKGMKNRTIFWMGVIYLISGGSGCFMAFPAFFSLIFYLPFSLLVIHWFQQKKAWIVPLYVVALVFYNFYCAYMAIAFMSVLYIIEALKKARFNILIFLRDGAVFLGLILLGVAMSCVMLIPAVQFIMESTEHSAGAVWQWEVTIGEWELTLFKPEIYIRILAKAFTAQRSVGFLGFLGPGYYGYEHVSLYISLVGITIMSYVFFMRDKISWIYKIVIVAFSIMMIFPFFSYLFSGTEYLIDVPYTRWIDTLPLLEIVILAHVFDKYGFENLKMKWLSIPIVLSLALLAYLIYYYYTKLTTTTVYAEEALIADAVFLGLAALYLLLILIFGWVKRLKWVRVIFWIEFVVAMGYMYGIAYYIPNKITLFNDMESINDFLNENLEQDQFYRVYVDVERFNVQDENFNRMTTFYTNTMKIFHSWSDSESDQLVTLLFSTETYGGSINERIETQEKTQLNTFTLYLNHVLGYKYLLVNAEYEYNLPEEYFTLIEPSEPNAKYKLYEIVDSEPFQVYESYMTYEDFLTYASKMYSESHNRLYDNKIAAQQLMLNNVLLDTELIDMEALSSPDLLETIPTDNLITKTNVTPYKTLSEATIVEVSGKTFYRYEITVGFASGGIYLKSSQLNDEDYGEVFIEDVSGDTQTCKLTPDAFQEVECGQFFTEPVAIYFEQTSNGFDSPKSITYRLERAIGQTSFLVYDLSEISASDINGYLRLSFTKTLDRVFVVDANGDECESLKGS